MAETKEPILTEDQILKAVSFYNDHTELIEDRMKKTSFSFHPSNEDKSDPKLWKPEHWKWFFTETL